MTSRTKVVATKRPLSGVRVLVGRARNQASALSSGLKALGAEIIEIPFIEIRKPRSYKPLDNALKNIEDYDWLILTSVNGVDALSARMQHLRIRPSKLANLKIAAIGPATADEIRKLGLKVAVVPKRYIAESVVESLQGRVEGKRVLLARAKVARDVIPRELRKMGAKVDVVEAYETIVPGSSKKQLQSVVKDPLRRPHIVCFTSSSTVRNFVALIGPGQLPDRRRTHAAPRGTNSDQAPSIPDLAHPRHTRPGPTCSDPTNPDSNHPRPRGTPANSPALQRRVEADPTSPVRTADSQPDGMRFASIGPITSATLREQNLPVDIEATEYTIPGLIRAISKTP